MPQPRFHPELPWVSSSPLPRKLARMVHLQITRALLAASLQVEMNFYFHLDRNWLPIEAGRLVFPFLDSLQRRPDQQTGSAHNVGLHDISLLVDDGINDDDALDLSHLGDGRIFHLC